MIDADLYAGAETVLSLFRAKGWTLCTAESCTGGLVAGALTAVPGSSDVVDRGFVTYSNTAKMEMLGVPSTVLETHGAVSEQTARAMAQGACRAAGVNVAVSITGVAGPGGGSLEKPVGLVHFACARRDGIVMHREMRFGEIGRDAVRHASVLVALEMLAESARD